MLSVYLVIILPYLTTDKGGICLLFQVTHQIKLFRNDFEMLWRQSVTQKVACVWFYNVIRYKVQTTLVIPDLHEIELFQQDSKILTQVRQPFKNPAIYNIICWFAGTNDSSTKRLMFQVLFFFHNFLQNSLQ